MRVSFFLAFILLALADSDLIGKKLGINQNLTEYLERHHRPPYGGGGYRPPHKPPPSTGVGAPNLLKVFLLAYLTSLAIGLHILNTNVNITDLSKFLLIGVMEATKG